MLSFLPLLSESSTISIDMICTWHCIPEPHFFSLLALSHSALLSHCVLSFTLFDMI